MIPIADAFWPGMPQAADVLNCSLAEIGLIAAFIIGLQWLKFYLLGTTPISRGIGLLISTAAGCGLAVIETRVFTHWFPLPDLATTGVLLFFILTNLTLATALAYPKLSQPPDPPANPPNSFPPSQPPPYYPGGNYYG